MARLARLLLRSDGGLSVEDREANHDQAVRLLLNAAALGVADAHFALGQTLEHSAFLQDPAAALRFYIKAAHATPVRY